MQSVFEGAVGSPSGTQKLAENIFHISQQPKMTVSIELARGHELEAELRLPCQKLARSWTEPRCKSVVLSLDSHSLAC